MAEAQDDHHGHDVHFESADAGASLTYPQQAGTIRKNGFLVIKGRPCKVGPRLRSGHVCYSKQSGTGVRAGQYCCCAQHADGMYMLLRSL